jgi:gliding-associated putative ABC transporter substrate-binding component GldG
MAQQKQFVAYILSRVVVQTVLVLGIVIFGFLLVNTWVFRIDLTEDERFSISEASHELAASLEDPLTIRAYFSDNIPERIRPFQRQVFDILSEYEAHGGGKIKIERHDPLSSSTAASEAQNYDVRPIELRVYEATEASALQVYGSIVLIYRDRASEVINIAQRYPQGFEGLSVLEYEISSKIWQLTHDKPKLGLTGFLERPGGRPGMPPQFGGGGQPRPEFNQLRRLLGESFDIEEVDLDQEPLDPKKIPLLVVVRPKEFSDVAVFRLDQYMMQGGRVLVFVTQGLIDQTPWGKPTFTYTPFKTGLDKWLEHHGLRVPNEFVCQFGNAIPIQVETMTDIGFGPMRAYVPKENWFWPVIGAEGALNQDNPAVQTLKQVVMLWAHPVDILQSKLGDKQADILVQSHANESWRWKEIARVDRRHLTKADNPSASDFVSSPVAVAVEGTFGSYFDQTPVPPSLIEPAEEDAGDAEKKDAGDAEKDAGDAEKDEGDAEKDEGDAEKDEGDAEKKDEEGEKKEDAGEEKKAKGPDVIKKSTESTQLVVVGNAFFISDLWLQQRQPERGLLALNLVDWLARSKALIALRAKRFTNRALVDEAYKDDLENLKERFEEGELDEPEFVEEMERARDRQQTRWKSSRWFNILAPCFLVLFVGALVWVVRASGRTRVSVPEAVPPESLVEGD